jgi:NDP-sugar pyrophosphorylase family protein
MVEAPETGNRASSVRQAVLLVGGLGTRLRPLTCRLPKALMPVANLPLVAYEIIPLVRAGVERIIFATGYRADQLRDGLGDGSRWGAEFVYAEEAEPLGTAGAIANVREHLDGPFLACNGDMIYDVDLAALAWGHVERQALVTFCVRQATDIEHFGLVQWEDNGRVTAFCEKVSCDETGRNTVNTGFYVMSPEVFDHVPSGQPYSSERQLFPRLLAAELPLYAHLPQQQGYWADVGRLGTYRHANGDVLAGALAWYQPARLGSVDPGATLAESVCVGSEATIAAGAVIGERVAVGARCTVGAGAVIRDSVLWPGTRIGEGAHVTGCVIAGAEVPAGAELTDEVVVD